MADAGEAVVIPIACEIVGVAQIVFYLFVMGSYVLAFSIMMDTVTSHATCTIEFGVVGLIVSLGCTLPRTLQRISYTAVVSFVSIVTEVLITMIGVGCEKHGNGKVDAVVRSNLYKRVEAVMNIAFAYAGEQSLSRLLSSDCLLLAFPVGLDIPPLASAQPTISEP